MGRCGPSPAQPPFIDSASNAGVPYPRLNPDQARRASGFDSGALKLLQSEVTPKLKGDKGAPARYIRDYN